MFQLKTGYFISGIIIGFYLLYSFLTSLPDKKLHIVFCNVGQGDGAYVRFPGGRDMVVDGGPSEGGMVACLGRHMPFWDRSIDLVMLTHPQKDHMQGLLGVVGRFRVGTFVQSDIQNNTDGYTQLVTLVKEKKIPRKFITAGEKISVDESFLTVLWPSVEAVASMKCDTCGKDILGVTSDGDLNSGAIVFWLQYKNFTTLFTADADIQVESAYNGSKLLDNTVEVLKVPHHGSKTGMSSDFVRWLRPQVSIISVGKNTYGHPTAEAIDLLTTIGSKVIRTDQHGDIEVISDGINWFVR